MVDKTVSKNMLTAAILSFAIVGLCGVAIWVIIKRKRRNQRKIKSLLSENETLIEPIPNEKKIKSLLSENGTLIEPIPSFESVISSIEKGTKKIGAGLKKTIAHKSTLDKEKELKKCQTELAEKLKDFSICGEKEIESFDTYDFDNAEFLRDYNHCYLECEHYRAMKLKYLKKKERLAETIDAGISDSTEIAKNDKQVDSDINKYLKNLYIKFIDVLKNFISENGGILDTDDYRVIFDEDTDTMLPVKELSKKFKLEINYSILPMPATKYPEIMYKIAGISIQSPEIYYDYKKFYFFDEFYEKCLVQKKMSEDREMVKTSKLTGLSVQNDNTNEEDMKRIINAYYIYDKPGQKNHPDYVATLMPMSFRIQEIETEGNLKELNVRNANKIIKFFQMIECKRIKLIISLGNKSSKIIDHNNLRVICPSDKITKYGDYKVEFTKDKVESEKIKCDGLEYTLEDVFITRKLKIINSVTGVETTVTNCYFNKWAALELPNLEYFLAFIKNIQKRIITGNPICVHCNTGLGRTCITIFCLQVLRNITNLQNNMDVGEMLQNLMNQSRWLIGRIEQIVFCYAMKEILVADNRLDSYEEDRGTPDHKRPLVRSLDSL